MQKIENYFKKGLIYFYGYSYSELPEKIKKFSNKNTKFFFKRQGQYNRLVNNLKNSTEYYSGFKGISLESNDITFLDQNAVKSTCIGYPSNSKFVFISLRYLNLYFFIFLGIFRRLLIRQISFRGLIWLKIGRNKTPWIVLRNNEFVSTSFNFSEKIGIKGLLNFLAKENINYVVARFFENLPEFIKGDNDIDLLVDSKDISKLNRFLTQNPGDIRVDIVSDIGLDYYGMPCYPPQKAKKVLRDAVPGPSNSRVPRKLDYLLLIIYHLLYHKGFNSGIPSFYYLSNEDNHNNKYMKVINNLNKDLKINVGKTMEEMDSFLEKNGWRPKIDTLTKISEWNEWVLKYHIKKDTSNIPLFIFVIKERFVGTEAERDLIEECKSQKLKIIDSRTLTDSTQLKVIEEIRGGVWNDALQKGMREIDYYPRKILIIWDQLGIRIGGISGVKEKIRKKIDIEGPSIIHSSDNYKESLEYINICMPDKYIFYKNKNNLEQMKKNYEIKVNFNLRNYMANLKSILRIQLINFMRH